MLTNSEDAAAAVVVSEQEQQQQQQQQQHESIAERIRLLCRICSQTKQQVHELQQQRQQLEGKRQQLLQQQQQLEAAIQKFAAAQEEVSSQSKMQNERINKLKTKVEEQTKKKQELNYANIWIRTGTACAALHHILGLRQDLHKLKQQLFTSEKMKEGKEFLNEVLSKDAAAVAALQRCKTLTESSLAALAKEKDLIQPGRLTYAEKEKLLSLLSSSEPETEEDKKLLLTFILCISNKINIPEEAAAAFMRQREDYYSINLDEFN